MFKTKPQVTLLKEKNLLLASGINAAGKEIRIVLDTERARQRLGKPLPTGLSYTEALRDMYYMTHAGIGADVRLFPAVQPIVPGVAYIVTGFDGMAHRIPTTDARIIRAAIDELLTRFGVLRTLLPAQVN